MRGDSSDQRWDASISAPGFAGSGLRARLSDLKAGVGWVTSAALLLAVPCASSPRRGGGGGRGVVGGATQRCRAGVLLVGRGKEEGLVHWEVFSGSGRSVVPPSGTTTQQEVKGPATLEFNEKKNQLSTLHFP